ncbi:Crp/Fnr family transcriptional regulator [Pedobacter sp. Du54]|uniref:Crp/Fnr family transcriptional regulator n=1 Tax=Pedobacter anseongensis TaxID=3133439 RepID=UPI00309907CA
MKRCDLNTCFLCQFSVKEWQPVIDLNKKNSVFKKGEQIFTEGEEVKGIYFIYDGKVKVHKYWDEEKEFIVRFAKKGDILGQLGLGQEKIYPVSATALEKTTVCYFPMDFFESSLELNPKFTYNLMRFFANELQEKDKKMRDLVHMTVKARIAQSFIALKNQFSVNEEGFIGIELTRQDLSAFAGVSYETLFKVIVEFTEQKMIKAVDKRYRIVDEEKLVKIIKDDQLRHVVKKT